MAPVVLLEISVVVPKCLSRRTICQSILFWPGTTGREDAVATVIAQEAAFGIAAGGGQRNFPSSNSSS